MGGRHPGHYFMDSDDFNEVVTKYLIDIIKNSYSLNIIRNDVCPIKINLLDVGVKRAGASSVITLCI